MKFTIDRSKWRCGGVDTGNKRGYGPVSLLNKKGFMCCLGFVEKQLGLNDSQILDMDFPEHTRVPNILCEYSKYSCAYFNSNLASRAACINDDGFYTDAEREAKLIELFAQHGHEIEFTGEYYVPATLTVVMQPVTNIQY